jgi:hypothetical protein
MTLVGLVSDYPLPELLFDLAARGRSGWLTLCTETHDIEIVLHHGGVVAASSTDSTCRLGQRFLARGLVTNEQLDAILSLQDAHNRKSTGELLVAAGYVAESDVQNALTEHVGDVLSSVLTQRSGCFSFQRGVVTANRVPVDISLEHAVFTAISQADEWLSQRLDSTRLDIANIVTPDMLEPAVLGHWPVIEALLDGATTLQEIVDLTGIEQEDARSGITVLHANGVVHVLAS